MVPAESPRHGIREMRIIATGMLVAMAAMFLAANAWDETYPALGFVKAFAEAAMVGGLADWFAVTALFRHPLGLPIPHTAIIPRNKDRIGAALAAFLRENFLIPRVVARRMRNVDIAGAIGRFLANPPPEGRLRQGGSRLIADLLESLDQERLGGMVKTAVASRMRSLEVSPLIGQALDGGDHRGTAHPDPRRHRHLGGPHPRRQRGSRSATWSTSAPAGSCSLAGLDAKLADGDRRRPAGKLTIDMAIDPAHPLRAKAEEALAALAWDMRYDPDMQGEGRGLEERDHRQQGGHRLARRPVGEQPRRFAARRPAIPRRRWPAASARRSKQLGETLQQDQRLNKAINQFARRIVVGTAATYGSGIVTLVSETVRGWDARTVTGRLENAVGRDLQYIRINGTLVGGLVGLHHPHGRGAGG